MQWDLYDTIHRSASGNYFSKPGVTTIAEKGPEIVLNPEDTQNILAAVRMVRATVNSGFANAETAAKAKTRASLPLPKSDMHIPASRPRCIPESASTWAQPHCLAFS